MSTEKNESEATDHYLQTEPTEMGNREYLDQQLSALRKKYAYEELSGLSKEMLQKEQNELRFAIIELKHQFPHPDYIGVENKNIQKRMKGNNYRGLSPLTVEQRWRISDTEQKCLREIDRAMTEAEEREKEMEPASRLGQWLLELVDRVSFSMPFIR